MIHKYSRYTHTKLYDRKGTLMLEHRYRYIFDLKRATVHIFKQGDRLDNIANQYYSNRQLWWVILDANPQYRMESDIPYGAELLIPDADEVSKCLEL